MSAFKSICRAIVRLLKQACALPFAVAASLKRTRRRSAVEVAEAERLDRIRNPLKYLENVNRKL